jgi:DNA primase
LGYAPDKWRSLGDFLKSRGYQEGEIKNTGLLVPLEDKTKSAYDRFRNRIIFPVFDLNGQVIGFSGRIFGQGEPKYINTPNTLLYDKSLALYGLDRAKLEIRKKKQAILVEGQLDVLMAHQAGFKNTVAASGTALTVQHLKTIKRYTENLAMAFDMDIAGESATKRGIELALQSGLNTNIITLKTGKDPADVLSEDADIFTKALNDAKSVIEFYFASAFDKYEAQKVEGKKNIAALLLPVLKKVPNRIEQAHWLAELATKIKTDEKLLQEEMQKINVVSEFAEAKEGLKEDCANTGLGQNLALMQHSVGLLLAFPQHLELAKQYPLYLIDHPELEDIYKRLKEHDLNKKFEVKAFQRRLPAHLADVVSNLLFRIEAIEKDNLDPAQEITFSFSQLKKRYLQDKLGQLNQAIKEAEGKKDPTQVKDLCAKFNKLSQQLAGI